MSNKTLRQDGRSHRSGVIVPLVIIAVVAVFLVGGGMYYYFVGAGDELAINPIVVPVERGEFVAQVVDQGEVQSSENVEIRCEARARNGQLTVLEVVPEGTLVKGGDFLVRLDSTSFETELESQKITVANAETAVIQAEADLTTAQESLREYNEGIYVEKLKTIENDISDARAQIATARQELVQAKADLDHSRKLQAKGFITSQQLATKEFAVSRAEFALQRAENLLELALKQEEVLKNITRIKETAQLESDIKAAKVKLENTKSSLEVERNKLREIEEMIKKCVITVPPGVEGQVVYAKESSRGGNDWVLEEGTTVRENQVLIRLPNPQKMEVKALYNEQSITLIEPGMPAVIRVDALNNQILKGVVTRVSQYAESSGWFSTSIRKYAVNVKILDPPKALKPGMNASVTIQVRYEPDVLIAPIQTVYGVQDRHFVMVKKSDKDFETREVEVDGDNSKQVVFKSGVTEGELLVMNPGAYKDYLELPELKKEGKIELSENEQMQADEAQKAAEAERLRRTQRRGDGAASAGGEAPAAGGGGAGGSRPRGGPGGAGGGGGGFDMNAMLDRMMQRYDTNSDGKIDADEMAALDSRAVDRVKAADADGDGSVTREEMKRGVEEMMKRFREGGGGGPGGGGGRGGNQQ